MIELSDMIATPARILIVDDERANREILKVLLAPEGYVLLTAASGEEALATIDAQHPDLVLLDVMMTGLDGYQVAARIKGNPVTRSIPIVLVTALDDRHARMLGLSAGAEDFLSKPVDRAELSVRVRNLLRLKAYGDYHARESERLEHEVALRTADLRLERDHAQAAEERTRFALENAHVGIWDMDYATGAVRWSDLLERQHGLESGTFGGTFGAFIERVHRDDRKTVRDTVASATKSGEDFSLEYRAIGSDGSVRWLCGTGRFHLGERGEPLRGLGISQDITARHTLEEHYRQSQKMEAVGQLASGVAHDFNNLLAVILGFAELIASDGDTTNAHGAELSEIITAANRAAALTKHLLAFSRQQVLQPAPLDVNALVTGMSGLLGVLTGSGIKVTLDLAPSLSPATADYGQFEQVVMNLVINARDAMPDGGNLTIETTDVDLESSALHDEAIVKGEYVLLAITDTGSGMTKEIQRHLFEPFFTTKENGSGTGLGLSTAYGIVKQSKGYIWVQSEPGVGTTFKVYLPRIARTRVTPTFGVAIPASSARVGETLLLVEDEESIRKLAKRILDRAGYRVLEAANGDEAERSFAQNAGSIDLVVTDMMMPGCSGPELLNRLWARSPALKALYMSGHGVQPHLTGSDTPRDLPFVQKPFTAAELERQVRYALDR
jgi:PAS domain S-box-containing protein